MKKKFMIVLDENVHEEVRKLAFERKVSMAEIIREALIVAIGLYKKDSK
jgi:predicted HicB family RNase H-like nuclease